MDWEMTVMLFCAVGILWMAIAMPYSRGWRYLNVRMEDSLSRSNALLEAHAMPPEGKAVDDERVDITGPAAR
ncbi:Uncharacterised protein [Xylophilus ampelinus]|nr:Uncharacterised protein [Xylophilus ampelinus]|tara:strand:- start:745 stop:960 length:216 start_codon:yes stop_codon:yes gene_type:complete